jgi:hypothetical protein
MAITDPDMKAPTYFEADGAIRAANNRAFLLGICSAVVAIVVGLVAFLKINQPPTVIRVGNDGTAEVISPKGDIRSTVNPNFINAIRKDEEPSETEKVGYVNRFLNIYLTYDSHTLPTNWSSALNMTTINLRNSILTNLKANDTVTLYQNGQVRSDYTQVSATHDQNALVYTVYGKRNVHSVEQGAETSKEIIEVYTIRLVTIERTPKNPEGLLVADFTVKQISGNQQSPVTGNIPSSLQSGGTQ